MKTNKIITIVFSLFFCLGSCQSIININGNYEVNIPNAYYKDVDNKLNDFEGTWVFDDGINYVKFVLVKKTHMTIWNHYEDYLVGELQIKKNGTDLINTLNNLSNSLPDPRDYNIHGNYLAYNTSPFSEFTSNNFRLKGTIKENGCLSEIDIRTLNLNGQLNIQIFKRKSLEIPQSCVPILEGGFYYLKKQ